MISDLNHSVFSENMKKCHDYIKALEDERRKIQVFQRELPLCLELVTKAIETCKNQLSGTTNEDNLHGQSECSEQTSSDVPVLEEFIPIKRPSDSDGEELEISGGNKEDDRSCEKSDWLSLRSVQQWNQTPDPPSKEVSCINFNRPFKKQKGTKDGTSAPAPASTSSTAEDGGGNNKEGNSLRKARRSWSPELHRRFLQALQELGGSHVATPKQIREIMKVDGLTNDEIKSHLQKYRLHTRRPSPSSQNNNAQPPQFVVVGGLWVPPEFASMATNTASAATVPPPPAPNHIKSNGSRSCSSTTSSSMHSITALSPSC